MKKYNKLNFITNHETMEFIQEKFNVIKPEIVEIVTRYMNISETKILPTDYNIINECIKIKIICEKNK